MSVILYNGEISTSPTRLDDKVLVSVPDRLALNRQVYGPLPFAPNVSGQGGVRLPQFGDKAVLGIDEGTGEQWIVRWHRADASSPPYYNGGGVFVGQMTMSGLVAIPAGWLDCDGSVLVAGTHDALRTKLLADGSPWGVSGGNPKLPNTDDLFPIGVSGTKAVGSTGGEATHLLTAAEAAQKAISTGNDTPDHTHPAAAGSFLEFPGSGGAFAGGPSSNVALNGSTGGASARHTHPIAGSDAVNQHNNMPPWLAFKFLIYAGE